MMLNLSAILMLIFGCLVLYGGLILCITIAVRRGERPRLGDTESTGQDA
jgi:hypothetical protein